MTDRDPVEAGRAWMRGDLPSGDYFALVRRQVWAREPGRWRVWWRKVLRK